MNKARGRPKGFSNKVKEEFRHVCGLFSGGNYTIGVVLDFVKKHKLLKTTSMKTHNCFKEMKLEAEKWNPKHKTRSITITCEVCKDYTRFLIEQYRKNPFESEVRCGVCGYSIEPGATCQTVCNVCLRKTYDPTRFKESDIAELSEKMVI